ncbi:hypothetical protein HK099_000750 [Clydaea vesicula]|uniref:Uncharacterized protein n=1 Tax=Clydaea vesicula TaxID=447962 RepID=A0AAD5XXB8_9FUNG|nr:hypothetical protein HK099_000750 [Clydaea vesicula]
MTKNSYGYMDLGERARKLSEKKRTKSISMLVFFLSISVILTLLALFTPTLYTTTTSAAGFFSNCTSSNLINCRTIKLIAFIEVLSMVLNSYLVFHLFYSLKVMKPLSLTDPSIIRLKSGLFLHLISILMQCVGLILLFKFAEFGKDVVHGSSLPLLFSSALATFISFVSLIVVIVGSVKEAKKVFHSARTTVVRGVNEMKRMSSLDFAQFRKEFQVTSVVPPKETHTFTKPEFQLDANTFVA